MPGLEDKQLPNIPKVNDSLGGPEGLENTPIPPNGQIADPTFTELADGNDAPQPQKGVVGLEDFKIPANGQIGKTFSGDGLAK
tara:strand:+ start:5944 stop:6192 length:249 start_codon:yes stop_codon:yes gene_type:complete